MHTDDITVFALQAATYGTTFAQLSSKPTREANRGEERIYNSAYSCAVLRLGVQRAR